MSYSPLGGRPSTLTPELADTYLAGRRLGMSRRASAHLCGVSESTARSWEQTDAAFRRRVREAEGAYLREVWEALHERIKAGDTGALRCAIAHRDNGRERTPDEPSAFADAVRAYMLAARERDGLEPPGEG